jgi:hypothetical protein
MYAFPDIGVLTKYDQIEPVFLPQSIVICIYLHPVYEDNIEGNQTYDVIMLTEWKVGKYFIIWANNSFCGSSWLHLIILWISL